MTGDVVLSQLEDGVLTVVLNRPDKLNAIDFRLMRLLQEALVSAAEDPAVRAVLLTGAGRGFCSGGDLRGAPDPDDPVALAWQEDPLWRTADQKAAQLQRFTRSAELLFSMPKPTVAAIRGPCVGAGLCLAAACDFRIVSRTARFSTIFIQSARSGDFGGSYFLTRLVGPARTRELYLLGETLDAAEAERIGLVTRLVEEEQLDSSARAFAQRLASGPPLAQRYIKQNIAAAEHLSLPQLMELEAANMMRASLSEDAREAYLAAKEQRPPKFTGR